MKIGIDARFYGGEQSKGLGRYTQKLIEYLAEHDHENEYVIFLQADSYRQWSIKNENFTPVLAPYHWYTFSEQVFMPFRIWREKVDFMHFPHFNVPLLYRKPFIVTIHDLIINHFPTDRATTLGPILYRFKHYAGQIVMKHAVKYSSKIITVSEFSKKDIIDYYSLPTKKVDVTYEAADVSAEPLTPDQTEKTLQKYGITSPFFLYIGNAYPHKNLELLLDVMKELKQSGEIPWKMVFVGKEDYFYARLKQQAWANDVDEYTVFTGFIPDADLPALYQSAIAYIFPSLYEGFGLPPLEAMSYGAPVLAAKSSCIPEVLSDAALYFDPKSISGIIDAIQTVWSNAEVREKLRHKGYERVKQFSWKKMMEQTLQIYESQKKEQTTETS